MYVDMYDRPRHATAMPCAVRLCGAACRAASFSSFSFLAIHRSVRPWHVQHVQHVQHVHPLITLITLPPSTAAVPQPCRPLSASSPPGKAGVNKRNRRKQRKERKKEKKGKEKHQTCHIRSSSARTAPHTGLCPPPKSQARQTCTRLAPQNKHQIVLRRCSHFASPTKMPPIHASTCYSTHTRRLTTGVILQERAMKILGLTSPRHPIASTGVRPGLRAMCALLSVLCSSMYSVRCNRSASIRTAYFLSFLVLCFPLSRVCLRVVWAVDERCPGM